MASKNLRKRDKQQNTLAEQIEVVKGMKQQHERVVRSMKLKGKNTHGDSILEGYDEQIQSLERQKKKADEDILFGKAPTNVKSSLKHKL